MNDRVTPRQKHLRQTPPYPATPPPRGFWSYVRAQGGREEEENEHSASVQETCGPGLSQEALREGQAFPLWAHSFRFAPPPPPGGTRSAPLGTPEELAPRRRPHPTPPRPRAHPAQCAGRLDGGPVHPGAGNRGLRGESQGQGASAKVHLP